MRKTAIIVAIYSVIAFALCLLVSVLMKNVPLLLPGEERSYVIIRGFLFFCKFFPALVFSSFAIGCAIAYGKDSEKAKIKYSPLVMKHFKKTMISSIMIVACVSLFIEVLVPFFEQKQARAKIKPVLFNEFLHRRPEFPEKNRQEKESAAAGNQRSQRELRDIQSRHTAGNRNNLVRKRRKPGRRDDPDAVLIIRIDEQLKLVHIIIERENRHGDFIIQEKTDRISGESADYAGHCANTGQFKDLFRTREHHRNQQNIRRNRKKRAFRKREKSQQPNGLRVFRTFQHPVIHFLKKRDPLISDFFYHGKSLTLVFANHIQKTLQKKEAVLNSLLNFRFIKKRIVE